MFNPKEISKELHSKLKTLNSSDEKMIEEVIVDIFPVKSEDGEYTLHYISCYLDKKNYKIPHPEILFATAPLYAVFRLENKTTKEFTESEVLLCDFPFFI